MHRLCAPAASAALICLLPLALRGAPPGVPSVGGAESTGATATAPPAMGRSAPPAPEGCEPTAPLTLVAEPGAVRGGRLAIEYHLTPGSSVAECTVEVEVLGAARVAQHRAPGPRGGTGTVVVEGASGAVRLVAAGRLAADDSTNPWQRVEREVTWGNYTRARDAVDVVSNGERFARVNATWRPAETKGGEQR